LVWHSPAQPLKLDRIEVFTFIPDPHGEQALEIHKFNINPLLGIAFVAMDKSIGE
jgi:hypothetical protein